MPERESGSGTLRSIDRDLRFDFARIRHAFPSGNPRDVTTVMPELAEQRRGYLSEDSLAAIRRYNLTSGCGDLTEANIDLLDRSETGIVIASGAPAPLTGPLLIIYKALTCLQLNTYCRETLGLRTVPMFWLTGNAPFEPEHRHVRMTNREDRVLNLIYEPEEADGKTVPFGRVPLSESVDFLLRLLERDTPESSFKPHLLTMLQSAREKSHTLTDWCARVLHGLFHVSGLIVIADDQPFASLHSARALAEQLVAPTRPARLVREAAELLGSNHYRGTMDLPEDAAPFSIWETGALETWTASENGFSSSNGKSLTSEEAQRLVVERHADVCIPGWMRPVIQGKWLPIVAEVASPSEARTAAHLHTLYAVAGVPMPLIMPRLRSVLIPRHIAQVMGKYDVNLRDFVQSRKALTDLGLNREVPRPVLEACDRKLDVMQRILDELRGEVADSNPELTGQVDGMKRALGSHMEDLRRALLDAKTESPLVVSAHLERARAHVFPEGKPQEQLLNVFPYLFGHGIELLNRLTVELDLFDFEVQPVVI